MEHFLEGIAPLRHWYINPIEKSNKYKSSFLSQLTKSLTEHFLQGNVLLLNAKPPLMSWRRSAFNEVNDWALSLIMYLIGCFGILSIIGIIHYEKYGQDPQKRSFSDQIFTFNCKICMMIFPIFWGIAQIRSITRPS